MNRVFFLFPKDFSYRVHRRSFNPKSVENAVEDRYGYLEAWGYSRTITGPLFVLITNMNQAIFFNIVGCHKFNILKGERYRRFQLVR